MATPQILPAAPGQRGGFIASEMIPQGIFPWGPTGVEGWNSFVATIKTNVIQDDFEGKGRVLVEQPPGADNSPAGVLVILGTGQIQRVGTGFEWREITSTYVFNPHAGEFSWTFYVARYDFIPVMPPGVVRPPRRDRRRLQ